MHDRPLTIAAVPDGLERVADDVDRPGVDPIALGVDQQVALQAVGQVEDDLAAGVLERLAGERVAGEGRAEREAEQVAGPLVAS